MPDPATAPASAAPAAGAQYAFGEPWLPEGGKEIVASTFAGGSRPLPVNGNGRDVPVLVADFTERARRDRAIACVNACAGLEIPADAPVGWAQNAAYSARLAQMVIDWIEENHPDVHAAAIDACAGREP